MTAELRGRPAPAGIPRVALLEPDELTADQKLLYTTITDGPRRTQTSQVPLTDPEGRLLGPFGLMLLHTRLGSVVQALGAALRFDDTFTARERELAILTVAACRASEFEWLAHENAARAAGLTSRQLQQVLDAEVPEGLAPPEEAIVALVRRLIIERGLNDDLYADATNLLGHDRLAALVWLVGYYEMLAVALATFRPPLRTEDTP
ncbi:carboxymuconolactone decarboxylase family protein [Rhodococcus opacus]|uniref:carboxymuconolactone decarboxylase family protein n=2 Tax=Rhodococcus TaxID=1827 RepID=UPI0015FEFF66|nr:carboxymuconolactone decarboxylase family protein [Rhodococcus opacus]QZS52517.1 carboxymuconolactone decarboxylase family protein [Rhodococcus opacus]